MSAQKFIAEADKLFEKEKYPEAIQKYNSAISAEPLNQIAVTKLANLYIQIGEVDKAKNTFLGMAKRLSEAGKIQVSIAIYKQALDLVPDDVELKAKFALICEEAGKLGDAFSHAQDVLKFFLARKKYFDAANMMSVIVRCQPKDDSFKLLWVEILRKSQAEQKLIHLLVGLFGPPGLTSQEFSVGGEPTEMSEEVYRAVAGLVAWFPRDSKITYAMAWAAYRRNNLKDFYVYLHETHRRDPDSCLGMLLLARNLAEAQKLNEAYFVYSYAKERISADRSVDKLILNRQVEAFVEKNGWISFTEGMGGGGDSAITVNDFRSAFLGGSNVMPAVVEPTNQPSVAPTPPAVRPPASPPPIPGAAAIEVPETPPVSLPPDDPEKPEQAVQDNFDAEIPLSSASEEVEIEFAGGHTRKIEAADLHKELGIQQDAELERQAEAAPVPASIPEPVQVFTPPPAVEPASPAEVVNPFPNPIIPQEVIAESQPVMEDATVVIRAPMASQEPERPQIIPAEVLTAGEPEAPLAEPVLDELRTEIFSPMEVLEFAALSRPPVGAELKAEVVEKLDEPEPAPMESAPAPEPEPPAREAPKQAFTAPSVFVPIPENVAQESKASANLMETSNGPEGEDVVDLGDDLLQGPTHVGINEVRKDNTAHFLKSVRKDAADSEAVEQIIKPEVFLKKADRYVAKRNYYLARKALRHAQAFGADPDLVKLKLHEIRKLELPEGMYASVSSDIVEKENTESVLEKLALDFDIDFSVDQSNSEEFRSILKNGLDSILAETSPEVIMDFGVGLYEMSLYAEAESLFMHLVEKDPNIAFDAYYLAALAKNARKDYTGAASILKMLSSDAGHSEEKKISVYYALGEVFERLRQKEKSRSFYEKVAQIDKNYRNIKEKLEG